MTFDAADEGSTSTVNQTRESLAKRMEGVATCHYDHLGPQIEQVTNCKQYDVARTAYTIVQLTQLPEDERLRFDLASQSSDIITHDGHPLGLFKHRIAFLTPRAVTGIASESVRAP